MDNRRKPKVGFVPCLTFVKQGVAKAIPEKLKVTKEEMRKVVKELRLREAEFRTRPDSEEPAAQDVMSDEDLQKENAAIDDYYDLDDYDDEPVESGVSYNTEAMLLNSAPESELDDDDSEDEREEFSVQPDDNILVCGQVSDDICLLQLYVLNTEKQEFFLLNDTYLPTYPMTVEWLDFNPKDSNTPGHYAAVGYMEPEIQVWDLNVSDCLEPAFTLGSKKHKKTMRHKDAVLDIGWNVNARNVLASGSADKTVILWDMNEGKSVTRLDCFREKVQSVNWHTLESQALITGGCDGMVKLFDCRAPNTHKTWQFVGEVERVMWNKFDPYNFFVSCEIGTVHYVDMRQTKVIWDLCAHISCVGGLAQSSYCKDMLITGSQDQKAKIWDLEFDQPTLVAQKNLDIGHIYGITACPDSPYVFAAGGANPENHLYVWDVRDNSEIETRFKDRLTMVVPVTDTATKEDDAMECSTAPATNAFKFKEKKRKKVASSGSSGPSVTSSRPAGVAGSAKNLSKKKKKKKV